MPRAACCHLPVLGTRLLGTQRQRHQNLTSASGDAPQVPPAPRCTPVVISTELASRLRLSLLLRAARASPPSAASKRRPAPAGLGPAGLHPQEVKPSKNNGSDDSSDSRFAQKAFEARGMPPTKRARARLAKPDLLANEVTGSDLIGVLRTPSTARIARGKFGRMCTYLKAIIHLVSHSRPDIFQPPMREVARSIRWAYFGQSGMRCRKYVRPLFSITLSGDLNSRISQI